MLSSHWQARQDASGWIEGHEKDSGGKIQVCWHSEGAQLLEGEAQISTRAQAFHCC